MYQGQTMKLPTHNIKLDELIFNLAYDNTKKSKDYINQILNDNVEKDEDAEKIKAKASKETKNIIHDTVIKTDDDLR